ncbi:hypothetical protein PNIG_a1499 [Pseudoalteromonas nigrifaciens]|uniref:Uncharacterized protein n=1 Tax=Pseudoalteromonas nigrifaciens TaxID=28109 RepID=A0AAC9UHW1_9GAMM|nr:hypothetical protein [Pseudoalteromonas nigrifaciens]ASM53649.1 hypothetical protein PNIG_a1499 [Pseudoalteromonas nigrifaciens]GEN40642.1 hypothetical protein PNI02_01080 [Pseudoalteromonas nigrifaciens]SUC52507.1 Uncharacterised protein [Pseudoalteromonas nigrifaciens]
MSEQSTTATNLVEIVFQEDLTKQGLADLRKKYPKKLTLDMKDDDDFKEGRKIRTERNKLVESIKRRRLDFTAEVKTYADDLSAKVNDIFKPIVVAFEDEDTFRKEEAARKAAEREAFLNKQRQEIADIRYFIEQCKGQPAKFIADTIESVDLIETDIFDKEIIHDAIDTKKEVLETLSGMYQAAKAAEAVEAEREQLRIQQEAIAQQERLQKQAQEIEQRINNLRNDPMNYFGKSSQEVMARIQQLENFTPSEDKFGNRTNEVSQVLAQVIQQLTMMHTQQLQVEQAQQVTSQVESQQVEQLQADVTRAAEQDAATESEEQHQALTDVNRMLDQNEPLLGNNFKSPVFENGEKLGYDPLDLWPSDRDRADNDELDRICNQLMHAESYIELLEQRLNKALAA